jgi:hypothetical protein
MNICGWNIIQGFYFRGKYWPYNESEKWLAEIVNIYGHQCNFIMVGWTYYSYKFMVQQAADF